MITQNSTGTPDTVLDVNPQVWPVMSTGYIEARRASLFLGVRVLTQAHTLGPRVVGGDMGPRQMRWNPRPLGQAR